MATYTALDDLDLPALAARYGLREPVAQPMKGGAANSSFRLDTPHDGRAYVLSALDNHDAASARHLAGVTRGFARLGLPTAQVVANRDGEDVTLVGDRPFLLKDHIAGEVEDPLPSALLPAAGELLATLHGLVPEGLDLPVGTRRLSAEHRAAAGDFPDRDFAAWLDGRLAEIGRHEAGHRRPHTAIHGDLFADNLIVRPDRRLSVIDWETASLDDPLLDLGMAAVGLCQDAAGHLSTERLRLLLHGYNSLRPLTAEDRAELPVEIVHAAVIIAFHRYHRHNVRFPNPDRATYYRLMVAFAESVPRDATG
ncbi:phosphotransferase [Streptomyces cocklensis]|uniref:Homoserine kinase n=1 Tax=Actinacidiphila cocklensis TaxID=887465 RepID=A0A9W4GQ17_9ACTN|nr:phosphotransferase [Actinacidiphila cocklensis]MDD1058050.1 phosphotransferase [Actinacidiphila cocklensis]CAG6393075.1 Homoserine kinase [Actinacidiphila cocklensis]